MANNPKRNKELFDMQELERVQNWLKEKIESYKNAMQLYRDEWTKWYAAYQCVYKDEHHSLKTESKLFDPETADAIDTVSKRINVAIFGNESISKFDFDRYVEPDKQKTAQAMWDMILRKKNLRKEYEASIKDGVITGTFLMKVVPSVKKENFFVTENGERLGLTTIDTTPQFEYVSIFDFIADPTQTRLSDCDVVAHKVLVDEPELDSDMYMADQVEEFVRTRSIYNEIQQGDAGVELDNEKRTFFDISGIDVNSIIQGNRRFVYHVYFKDIDEDNITRIYFAVVDAVTFKILRIEDNPLDGNQIPFVMAPYLIRPGCLFGMGAPEQAWALQIALNDLNNGFLQNVSLLNDLTYFTNDTSVSPPATSNKAGRIKFIPVMNPDKMIPLIPHNLPDVAAVVDRIREQIQKKTKATLMMQGMPLEGTRTATETQGVKDEQNLSMRDIIEGIVSRFIEPSLNLFRLELAQFYQDDNIILKVPVNELTGQFTEVNITFDDLRPLFYESNIKVISVQEQTQKQMRIAELRGLLPLAMQRPDLLNIKYIMKVLYFDLLDFVDFDKMLANNVIAGMPMAPDQENLILASGVPINTNMQDKHEEHLQLHQQLVTNMMQAAQQDQSINENPELADRFKKTMYNISNHMNEHMVELQKMMQTQGAENGQEGV